MRRKLILPIKAPPAMPCPKASRTLKAVFFGFVLIAPALTAYVYAGTQQRETPIVLAVRRARAAVVNISSEKRVDGRSVWDGALSESQRVNGMGSGIIIDERGYIITNAHVVDRVTSLRVRLSDGTQYDASTTAVDRVTDLALIKIDVGKPLPTIPLGTSSDLMLGETVVAVGNAFGYNDTVTSGLVSAIGRTVRLNEDMTYHDLIQTSADINPGNSGGALLNIDGELVGVNVAIRAGAQGISFAIPVDTVRRVAAEMLNIRRINQTWHGIQFEQPSRTNPIDSDLVVQKVEGPSQKGGVKSGDQVVRVGEVPVHSALEFERNLLGLKVGDQATVVVRRNSSEEVLTLTIEEVPQLAESTSDMVWRRLGLRLSMTDAYQIQRYQSYLRGGMYVAQVQPGSAAAAAGIRVGDFLLGLHKWETLSYENVVFVLTQHDQNPYDPMVVHVLRSGEPYELQLRLSTASKESSTKKR
jgi:serine protease Do